uniref:Cysteine protease inhibitor n=1 Tax=Haliotis diversicolor supertexta TaxID=283615 RepID=C5IGN7_HALDV|nr:cysteine protease inhibitor [Haliotis diversicolor supertexta]
MLMAGGLTNVDVNSTEVRDMANFALGEINGLQGAQNTMEEVISAKAQVVSGMNYMLTIRLKEGYKTQICYVKIWSQPWLHRKEMTEHSCSQVTTLSRKSAPVLGGVEPAHLSAPMQQAVSFAEDALNGKVNSMFRMVAEQVDHITQQVVAGMKYTFDLHLVTSSCMNNAEGYGKGITDCPASNSMPQRMTCKVSVLYQVWSDPKFQLLSDTCGQLA